MSKSRVLTHPNAVISIKEIKTIIHDFQHEVKRESLALEDYLSVQAKRLSVMLAPKLARLSKLQAEAVLQYLLTHYRREPRTSMVNQIAIEALRALHAKLEVRKPNHDAMFNNKEKVLFETAFAGAIHRNKAALASGIWPVAHCMANMLEATLFNEALMQRDANMKKVRANFYKINWDAYDEFNKFLMRDKEIMLEKDKEEQFKQWALTCLRSNDPELIVSQVFIIYLYVGFVMRTDRFNCQDLQSVPNEFFVNEKNKNIMIENYVLHKESNKPGYFIQKNDLDVIVKEENSKDVRVGASASRMERLGSSGTPLQNSSKENPPRNIAGIVPGRGVKCAEDIDLQELTPELQELLNAADLHFERSSAGVHRPCLPLADQIRQKHHIAIHEAEHFYELARKYDMPLVGGASGGIGAFEVAAKVTENLSSDQLQRFRLLVVAVYISKGFHAMHEMGSIHNFFRHEDIKVYQPGNYGSFFSAKLVREDDLEILQNNFPALLKNKSCGV